MAEVRAKPKKNTTFDPAFPQSGAILIDKPDGIAYLGIHVALVAFALVLVKNNKLAILKKW